MRAAQLKKRPRHFVNFTGLEVASFEQLVEAIETATERDRQEQKARRRASGRGCKAKLALDDTC